MRVHAVTWPEGDGYVSRCVGANVAAQGSTPDEAEANLAEAVSLSGVTLDERTEPPRLAVIDAPGAVRAEPEPAVDAAALLRDLEESGWAIQVRGNHVVLAKQGRTVVVPVAERIAPGVYRVIQAALAEARAAETEDRRAAFAKVDALFAANPHEGDSTAIIREMRDSR
jgi:predicted RNA binding protein YcfA (HicA-like mRNA interferase family)/predicted RNase H-like HicB family nuclease